MHTLNGKRREEKENGTRAETVWGDWLTEWMKCGNKCVLGVLHI